MDRKQWKNRLEEWHSPEDFRTALNELEAEYGKRLMFKAGFTDLFRDASTAGAFAFRRAAARVRLVTADQPDFEIEVLGRTQMYEVVEADAPGRRRSYEYEHQPCPVTGDSLPADFFLTAELAPQILEVAAKRKDKDIYLPEWGLVIFLNPAPRGGAEQQVIEDAMAQATAVVKDRFREVWVLWGDTAYNPWHCGKPGKAPLRPPDPYEDVSDCTPTPFSELFPD